MADSSLPPGPKARRVLGLMPDFRRDPLALITSAAREHGDVVRLPLGPLDFFLLGRPDLIEQVLVTENRLFVKGRGLEQSRLVLGNGLLTSEGEFWRRQRRLSQPAFHRERIRGYGVTMVDLTLRYLDRLRDGLEYDIAREMHGLTLAIAARTLFSADVTGDADTVGEALDVTVTFFQHRIRSVIKWPLGIPTPSNVRARRAMRHLHEITYRIIADRRASGADTGDLLSMLLLAVDEDGTQMTPQQLRDEAMTLFLAGHETTANAMAWTWYLLAQHPEAVSRLEGELDGVLQGRAPTPDDLLSMPFVEAVIHESMRLYPPAWIMGRRSTAPVEIGGYRFPAGSEFLMSQWVMHRDARYFDEPESFRPERWLGGLARQLPAYAYFPFGGGPRVCIGKSFAMMEACLLLATIAQRFRFHLVDGHPVEPQTTITLRPRYGIQVTAEARSH